MRQRVRYGRFGEKYISWGDAYAVYYDGICLGMVCKVRVFGRLHWGIVGELNGDLYPNMKIAGASLVVRYRHKMRENYARELVKGV